MAQVGGGVEVSYYTYEFIRYAIWEKDGFTYSLVSGTDLENEVERLISAIDDAVKGENVMSAFDNREFEAYKSEARERWGQTDAYKEYTKKTEDYSKDTWNRAADGLNHIFAEFAVCMEQGEEAHSVAAQTLVEKLQQHITENYYVCTTEILAGLGQMYVFDERFANNIDTHGSGTAAFVSEAIRVYCEK